MQNVYCAKRYIELKRKKLPVLVDLNGVLDKS